MGYIGIMKMDITVVLYIYICDLYWGCIGIMEKKMDTTTL